MGCGDWRSFALPMFLRDPPIREKSSSLSETATVIVTTNRESARPGDTTMTMKSTIQAVGKLGDTLILGLRC